MLCEAPPLLQPIDTAADGRSMWLRTSGTKSVETSRRPVIASAILLDDGVGRLILYVAWANTTDGQAIWAIMDGLNVW